MINGEKRGKALVAGLAEGREERSIGTWRNYERRGFGLGRWRALETQLSMARWNMGGEQRAQRSGRHAPLRVGRVEARDKDEAGRLNYTQPPPAPGLKVSVWKRWSMG